MTMIRYTPKSHRDYLGVRFTSKYITFGVDMHIKAFGGKKYLEIFYDEVSGELGLMGSDHPGLTITKERTHRIIRWSGAVRLFRLHFDGPITRRPVREEAGMLVFSLRTPTAKTCP